MHQISHCPINSRIYKAFVLCVKSIVSLFYALNYGQNYFRNWIQLFRTLRNIVLYTQLLKTSSRAIASTVYGFRYCHYSETINDADYIGWPIFSSSELLIPKLLEVFFMKLLKLFHKLWKFFFLYFKNGKLLKLQTNW